ncbi:carcinoembryonic antigen-related cell adhesion molecule 3-like, partial [Sigmodon hispidus]
SLLNCCHLPTTAQITIELVPPQVIKGENILLLVHGLPENILAMSWFKDNLHINSGLVQYDLGYNLFVPGLSYSGRETVYPNGSLWIQNVTKSHTGLYILRTKSRQTRISSSTYMYLHVH